MFDSELVQKLVGGNDGFDRIMSTSNTVLGVLFAVAVITVLVVLFFNAAKLSYSASNPHEHELAKRGIIVCFVCLAILGSLSLVYTIVAGFIFGGSLGA